MLISWLPQEPDSPAPRYAVDPSLLQPSLTDERPLRPLYSATACWMSAFFGGAFAGAIMFGLNSWRAGRLRLDLPWIVGGLLITWAALLFWSRALMPELISIDAYRLAYRCLALAAAAVWHWRLRPSERAQQMTGGESPSAWLPALGSIALGFIVTTALAMQLGITSR